MMNSLRGRLFIGLTAMVAIMGAVAGVFSFRYAFDESIEIQDATLTQVAALAVEGRFDQHMPPPGGVDSDNRLVIEELGTRTGKPARDDVLSALDDGLRDVTRGRERWRILIRTRTDGSRVMVGQPTAVREEIADEFALRTLIPLAILLPLMLLLIAVLVRQSLRPMTDIADRLDARRADDLDQLAVSEAPTELQPFIASINRLLQRIQILIERQRRFVADAAHELRTPITALTLQAENLGHFQLPGESAERLDALKQGARRTKRLIEQLLTLERVGFDRTRPTAVAALEWSAGQVVADLLPEATEKGVDLGFEQVEPCQIAAEPLMIEILIRNLVENALRHTPRDGRIDLSVRRENAVAILAVRDSGPGIPAADLDRIFEPFFRGSRQLGEGSGLGLSIVKRIAESLGGTVTVENIGSGEVSGLCATVRLPSSAS